MKSNVIHADFRPRDDEPYFAEEGSPEDWEPRADGTWMMWGLIFFYCVCGLGLSSLVVLAAIDLIHLVWSFA